MRVRRIHILAAVVFVAVCCTPAGGPARRDWPQPAGWTGPGQVPPPQRMKLWFGGDVMQHMPQVEAARCGERFDYRPVFAALAPRMRAADLTVVNLETTLTRHGRYTGYPLFRSPVALADALRDAGVDVAVLANNHCCDGGAEGIRTTVAELDRCGILHTGVFADSADYKKNNPLYLNRCGMRLAIVNYTYGTNGLKLPQGSELVIPLYDDETIDRQTKKAKTLADVVIVSIHWGVEDQFKPNAEQKRKAKLMADNGVDVIIGHHPHVLQPLEWIDRADGGKTLCMYSLGNFLSGMMYSRNMVGGILGFDLCKAANGVSVDNVSFIPTVSQYNKNVRGFKIYRFSEYTEALEEAHGAHKFDSGMSMKSMRKIIDNAIPKEFLTEDFYQS